MTAADLEEMRERAESGLRPVTAAEVRRIVREELKASGVRPAPRRRGPCGTPTSSPRCGHDPGANVARSWTFEIDREIKSGNAHIYNVGASRWRYAKDRDAWSWEFRAARLLQKIPKAMQRRRVTLTRLYSGRQREFDGDNFQTGAKSCVDALVLEGLLVGDDSKSAEINYAQQSGGCGLRVLLEEFA